MRITVAGGDTRELKLDRGGRAFSCFPGCVDVADGALDGPQPGHRGHTRAMLDASVVDRLLDCKSTAMCECGGQVELAAAPQRHQAFEVPPIRTQVDECWLYSGRCADCGKAHSGALAADVPKDWFGPYTLPLIGVLGTRRHLTQRKIHSLLDGFLCMRFSEGAIAQAHGKVADAP